MPETDRLEMIQVIPLTEGETKELIWQHLSAYHGISHHAFREGRKATKDTLLRVHDRQHQQARDGRGHLNIDHQHYPVELTEEEKNRARAVRDNTPISAKPLSASERKVLQQLVDNDFAQLKAEMRQFSDDALRAKVEDIRKEWADKTSQMPLWRKAADSIITDAIHALERTKAEALTAGIDLSVPSLSRYGETATYVPGLEKAEREARMESDRALSRAMLTLERQRLAAQRRVLVSGVTPDSAELLESIPDAKTLMVEAFAAEAASAPQQLEGVE